MMFITPTPPMPRVRVPMKSNRPWRPMVSPSMMGRNSSRPNIWMARLSLGEKRWRLPTATLTCSWALDSKRGRREAKTSTLA
jgi:hypothetical protein